LILDFLVAYKVVKRGICYDKSVRPLHSWVTPNGSRHRNVLCAIRHTAIGVDLTGILGDAWRDLLWKSCCRGKKTHFPTL